jgi:hypothetical protein
MLQNTSMQGDNANSRCSGRYEEVTCRTMCTFLSERRPAGRMRSADNALSACKTPVRLCVQPDSGALALAAVIAENKTDVIISRHIWNSLLIIQKINYNIQALLQFWKYLWLLLQNSFSCSANVRTSAQLSAILNKVLVIFLSGKWLGNALKWPTYFYILITSPLISSTHLIYFLAYFPYVEKIKGSLWYYLAVCVPIRVSVSPPFLLGGLCNHLSVRVCVALSLLGNGTSVCVRFPHFCVFYAVRVVSKENRLLVLPRTSCVYYELTLLCICVCPTPNYFVCYAVRVVSKESRRLALPRTFCTRPVLSVRRVV